MLRWSSAKLAKKGRSVNAFPVMEEREEKGGKEKGMDADNGNVIDNT
jgi:hypothetical protein